MFGCWSEATILISRRKRLRLAAVATSGRLADALVDYVSITKAPKRALGPIGHVDILCPGRVLCPTLQWDSL
jgi:hypothetical protein